MNIKIFLFIAFLSVSSLAFAKPIIIPKGNDYWNVFHFLGFSEDEIAIRELRTLDVSDEESENVCVYPSAKEMLKDRPRIESDDVSKHPGVILKSWALPKVGHVVLPTEINSFEVYKPKMKSEGCSSESEASEALKKAKNYWGSVHLNWELAVQHAELYEIKRLYEDFKGSCFVTKKSKKGCELNISKKIAGSDLKIKINLRAQSECVKKNESELEVGCKLTHHFNGEASFKAKSFPFEFETTEDVLSMNLRAVEAYSAKGITIAVFYFSKFFVSSREKVPVILRLE